LPDYCAVPAEKAIGAAAPELSGFIWAIIAISGKLSVMILAKPDGAGAAFQLRLAEGEKYGLLTAIATTESVSSCMPMIS
jgi:hypothetical protein